MWLVNNTSPDCDFAGHPRLKFAAHLSPQCPQHPQRLGSQRNRESLWPIANEESSNEPSWGALRTTAYLRPTTQPPRKLALTTTSMLQPCSLENQSQKSGNELTTTRKHLPPRSLSARSLKPQGKRMTNLPRRCPRKRKVADTSCSLVCLCRLARVSVHLTQFLPNRQPLFQHNC